VEEKKAPTEPTEKRDELEDLDLPAQVAEDVRGGGRKRSRGSKLPQK
jgi:hypothetical protein